MCGRTRFKITPGFLILSYSFREVNMNSLYSNRVR